MNVIVLLRILGIIFCLGMIYSGVKFYYYFGDEIPTRSRKYAFLTLISMVGTICVTIISILQD